MKLYLLQRTDDVGWDETAGYVVRAENKNDALKLAGWGSGIWGGKPIYAEYLGRAGGPNWNKAGKILEDFRAG